MENSGFLKKGSKLIKVINVVGARPNFIKIAPLIKAMNREHSISQLLLHTGQHYGSMMSGAFFTDLDIKEPDIDLGVGSNTHDLENGVQHNSFVIF